MRFKFELDSNEKGGADRFVVGADNEQDHTRPLPFVYVTPIGAPIIYNPNVADANGDGNFQQLVESYTVQRHQCSFNGVNYVIPHVLINANAAGSQPPAGNPTQVQFFTQGLFVDTEPANLWYQTMSVMPPSNSFLPFRHRLIDQYNPAPPDPLPNVVPVGGSDVALAVAADISVNIPNVGLVLFSWQVIDGIEDLFLQRHA
jgi:hypothetical protein